jgi:hypothetical protein
VLTETPNRSLRLDLVALGDRDVAHVVAEAGQAQAAQTRRADRGATPRSDAGDHGRGLDVAGHGLAAHSRRGLDVAELTVAVGRLVEVHEVHVDGRPRERHAGLGVQVSSGFCRASSPLIHILAGEKVCIQAITPTHSGALFASSIRRWIESASSSTGFQTNPDREVPPATSSSTMPRRLRLHLVQRLRAVRAPGCR